MKAVILLVLLGTALAAVPRKPHRIVGGSPTEITRHPYMANMQFLWWGVAWTQWCGGALLTTRTVLSSAYCLYEGSPNEWRVRLGSSQAHSGGSVHEVSRIVVHERYNEPAADNDLAIVWMETPAVLSDTINTIRVAGGNYILQDGTSVALVGWGAVSSGGLSIEQLNNVNVNIINQDLCTERYRYLKSQPGFEDWPSVSPGMICTGILNEGGKDVCHGDIGGPVVYEGDELGPVLMGVVSWGYDCGHDHYPAVNTRVSAHIDWIVANGSA